MRQKVKVIALPARTPVTKLRIAVVDENGEGDQWSVEEFGAETVTLTRTPIQDEDGEKRWAWLTYQELGT